MSYCSAHNTLANPKQTGRSPFNSCHFHGAEAPWKPEAVARARQALGVESLPKEPGLGGGGVPNINLCPPLAFKQDMQGKRGLIFNFTLSVCIYQNSVFRTAIRCLIEVLTCGQNVVTLY